MQRKGIKCWGFYRSIWEELKNTKLIFFRWILQSFIRSFVLPVLTACPQYNIHTQNKSVKVWISSLCDTASWDPNKRKHGIIVEDVPACGREVGTRWSLKSISMQTIPQSKRPSSSMKEIGKRYQRNPTCYPLRKQKILTKAWS